MPRRILLRFQLKLFRWFHFRFFWAAFRIQFFSYLRWNTFWTSRIDIINFEFLCFLFLTFSFKRSSFFRIMIRFQFHLFRLAITSSRHRWIALLYINFGKLFSRTAIFWLWALLHKLDFFDNDFTFRFDHVWSWNGITKTFIKTFGYRWFLTVTICGTVAF